VKHPPAFFIQKGTQLMIGLIENPPTKRRAKLCLHCGGNEVTRAEVQCTETPRATDTWQPIPHIELIEQVEEALTFNHLQIGNVVFIAALPFWGKLSDRIGRKKVLWAGAGGAAMLHFPMTWLLKDSAWQLAVGMSVMLIFIAASAAIVPAVFAELFPTSIRTVGVGVPYSICVAAFGGTAPYLQQWLRDINLAQAFNVYAVVLLVISVLFIFSIPETRGKDLRG